MTWSVVPIPVRKQANPKAMIVPSTDPALPAYRGAGQDAANILESFNTKPEVFAASSGAADAEKVSSLLSEEQRTGRNVPGCPGQSLVIWIL